MTTRPHRQRSARTCCRKTVFASQADWLNAASRTGNVLANLMLARVYQLEARDLEGDARKEAMEFVLEQYLHAIAVGSDEAMFALAGLYLDGVYGDENIESGKALLKQAADLQNPNELMWLGHMYTEGVQAPKDPAIAQDYYPSTAASTRDTRPRDCNTCATCWLPTHDGIRSAGAHVAARRTPSPANPRRCCCSATCTPKGSACRRTITRR